MKSFGKILTIAALAVGFGVAATPNALACGSCGANVITQPAVIDTSLAAPVVNTTLMQPAVIDTSLPAVLDNRAAVDYCGTCVAPRRHHLLGLELPFFGLHLF